MGFAKARESRCGNLGLLSLWPTWVVGTGWIFTHPGQSSVAVGQQKSLVMNLHVILPGSCQKSCQATCLFSWCFARWKHRACAWACARLVFPVAEPFQVWGCPCKVPLRSAPGDGGGDGRVRCYALAGNPTFTSFPLRGEGK